MLYTRCIRFQIRHAPVKILPSLIFLLSLPTGAPFIWNTYKRMTMCVCVCFNNIYLM